MFDLFRHNLATLALLHPPDDIYDARSGDSLTVCLGPWLGVPALPYIVSLQKYNDVLASDKEELFGY